MKQSTALDILKTGHNVFLTGSAGAGKTYTLNQYIHYLQARQVPVAITASTGIAATHMNGTTIHSWSGIGIRMTMEDKQISQLKSKKSLKERLEQTQVLIIDEISMLHAKQLDLINQVLKVVRNNDKAFGGIQVVLSGDFFQLPPVGERGESNRDKFAFMSKAWLEAQLHVCYLTEQHRQQKNTSNSLSLNDILNQIRQASVTHDAIEVLHDSQHNHIGQIRTRLYTHNVNVNSINDTQLSHLTGEAQVYHAMANGDPKLIDMLKKSVRTPDELTLKIGAKVMFVKNIPDLSVCNGTMGEVVKFVAINDKNEPMPKHDASQTDASLTESLTSKSNDELAKQTEDDTKDDDAKDDDAKDDEKIIKTKYPVIRLNTGREVIATPEQWVVEDEIGLPLATYWQVPLSLAWAITVHKSQGMTLDAAEIDLRNTFELGQGYVALSRLTDLSGLKLLGFNQTSLNLDPLARGADKRFLELSAEVQATYDELDKDAITQAHQNFVIQCGGTNDSAVIADHQKKQEQKKQQQQKKEHLSNQSIITDSTIDITKRLLAQSLTIAETAQERKLAQATIMRHLQAIKEEDPNFPCEHLRPNDKLVTDVYQAYDAIMAINDPNDFDQQGNIKLKPIFDRLHERVSYNDIRLALIFKP